MVFCLGRLARIAVDRGATPGCEFALHKDGTERSGHGRDSGTYHRMKWMRRRA